MEIVKYCKDIHRKDAIEKGRIYIGTFHKYKNIENENLQDIDEGSATPAIFDDEKDVVLSEEDNTEMLKHSSIKLANGWKLQIPKGMPLWLEQPDFNTFIFCTSQVENATIDGAKRLGYENYYSITNPYKFGRIVMETLMKEVKSKFGMTGHMGPVNYVPRKIKIINEGNPSTPFKTFTSLDLYTKNEKFKEDNEFRFIFLEYSNAEKTQYNSLYTDGIIIENKEICKWIE